LAALLIEILGEFIPPKFESEFGSSSPRKGRQVTPIRNSNGEFEMGRLADFTPQKLKRKILLKAGPERELSDEMLRITHIVIVDHGKWEQMKGKLQLKQL